MRILQLNIAIYSYIIWLLLANKTSLSINEKQIKLINNKTVDILCS